jgi:hypothetical protein
VQETGIVYGFYQQTPSTPLQPILGYKVALIHVYFKKKKRGVVFHAPMTASSKEVMARQFDTDTEPEVFIVLKDISIQYFPRVTTLLSVQVFVLFSKLSL